MKIETVRKHGAEFKLNRFNGDFFPLVNFYHLFVISARYYFNFTEFLFRFMCVCSAVI